MDLGFLNTRTLNERDGMMRLAVYVDGFNLYNAINDLAKENEALNVLK